VIVFNAIRKGMKINRSKIWDFIHILFMVVIYLDNKLLIKDEVWGQLFIIYFILLKTLNFINSFKKKS
jgi:hypothetical protein